MAKNETSTSQFGLVSGIQQPVSDLITAYEPRALFAPEVRKGQLYIVVQPAEDLSRGLQACQLVARTIRKSFYEDSSFSITASLREAIRTANEVLYKHNFNVARHKRTHVGLTCAVLKEHDLFMAQVAPAQAYVLTEGKLRAMPTHLSWNQAHMTATPFSKDNALGSSLFVDPELYRCRLRLHEGLLLGSSNIAPLFGREEAKALLADPQPADAIEQVRARCLEAGISEAHAIIVKMQPALSDTARRRPVSGAGLSERGRLALHTLGRWVGGITGEMALAARSRRHSEREAPASSEEEAPQHPAPSLLREAPWYAESGLDAPPEQPELTTYFAPKPLPIDMGESLAERHEREAASKAATLPPSSFLGEGTYDYTQPPSQEPIDLSDVFEAAAHAHPYQPGYQRRPWVDMSWSERLAQPLRLLGARLKSEKSPALARARLSETTLAHNPRLARQQQGSRFPWMLFLLLVISVTFLILYGISLSRRSADERTLAYLDEAERRMQAVYATDDGDIAAERLEQAAQAIEEVRASPLITDTNVAFWLRYQDLQSDFEEAQAAIHMINYLDDIKVIAEHPIPRGRFSSVVVPPPSSNITDTQMLEALRYIYALDITSDEASLYRIPRDNGPPEVYLSPDDVVRDTLVGALRAQAWRFGSIVAVDEGNNGYGYYFRDGSGWSYIRLGGSEIWTPGARIDLETYDGNLYVWGAEPNEILKFSSGRYGDIPSLWIDPAALEGYDLGTSIDMAVDGFIYLLQPNGHVLVLNLGRLEREIVPEAVSPPVTATRFFITGTPGEGSVFLLDTPNERIIQMNKLTGEIVQQMVVQPDSPVQLNQLTDIYIDTSLSRPVLYLVNGGQILQTHLPTPPVPFEAPTEPLTSTGTLP